MNEDVIACISTVYEPIAVLDVEPEKRFLYIKAIIESMTVNYNHDNNSTE